MLKLITQRRPAKENICAANDDPPTRAAVASLSKQVPPKMLEKNNDIAFPACLCGDVVGKPTEQTPFCAYHQHQPVSRRKGMSCAENCDGWRCEKWRGLTSQLAPLVFKEHTTLYGWLVLLHFGILWETEAERDSCQNNKELPWPKKHLWSAERFVKEQPKLAALVVILLCWETGIERSKVAIVLT